MIIPCIDLQDGMAVQLVRGRERKLAVPDVFGLLDRFGSYPVLHIIDLDAAMRRGSNSRLCGELCRRAHRYGVRVRVGGGVRTVAKAAHIISWGASQVIIGSAAFGRGAVNHVFLRRLASKVGRRRIIIALDTEGGQLVVSGWREKLRLQPKDVFPELERYASGFLCTYVDNEGTMRGTNLPWFRSLRRATRLPITAAGGIHTQSEVRALARMKMDAAVGMALYLNKLC
jgi:phosphoribosylformimino-5-aminoimidazole carboxamide ribonucleotide (ProFAR) isomerase